MSDLFSNFPNERFLLLALCVIGVVALSLLTQLISQVANLKQSIAVSLSRELPEAISAGILQAEKDRQAQLEFERLNREIERFDKPALGEVRRSGKPFTFTLDEDVAEILEEMEPGSTAGWEKLKPKD